MFKKINVTRNMFDVFYGEGWNTCARIRKTHNGQYVLVKTWGNKKQTSFWLSSLDNI